MRKTRRSVPKKLTARELCVTILAHAEEHNLGNRRLFSTKVLERMVEWWLYDHHPLLSAGAMKPRHVAFLQNLARFDGNAAKAARRSGFSPRYAKQEGYRLKRLCLDRLGPYFALPEDSETSSEPPEFPRKDG